MSISTQINEDIKKAMLARDEARLRALRAAKSAFLLALTDKNAPTELDDAKAIQVLQKLAKQRKDSIEIFTANGRQELAEKEQEELIVLESFLPKAMDENEIREFLQNLIQELSITEKSQLGKVMPEAIKRLSGKADGKTVNQILNQLLV